MSLLFIHASAVRISICNQNNLKRYCKILLHLLFSNRGGDIKKSTKLHFLPVNAKSFIFVCTRWPLGYLWPGKKYLPSYLTQESKQSFETAVINLRWQVLAEKVQLSRDVDISQGRKRMQPTFQHSCSKFGENNEIKKWMEAVRRAVCHFHRSFKLINPVMAEGSILTPEWCVIKISWKPCALSYISM